MEEETAQAQQKDTDRIVEEWFEKWFHNTPGISDSVLIYNRLRESADDLKEALKKEE